MSLLQMSLAGAAIILAVTVIRAAGINKLPKTAFLVLWGVALVRLLIPYAVPSAFSVYSLWNRFVIAADVPSIPPAKTPVGNILPISPIQNVTPGTAVPAMPDASLSAPKMNPWVVIWWIGMLACGVFFVVSYFRCRQEFKQSLPVDKDASRQWLEAHRLHRPIAIRYSDRISAPLTYGIFRPVILMPKTADWNDLDSLQYVLAHEYVHIRRFDAVTKLVLAVALCIHWFNPAVWLMYVLANRDMELSCDEAVVRQFGERTKAAYAMTLIRMEETRSGLSPLCNNFSKNAIEERIIAIMKMKKTSMAALLVALALVVCVTTGFATSAQATSNKTADEKTTDISQNVAQVTGESTVISYADPRDGKNYYSWDNGTTWTPMTDEEFNAASTPSDVEWWTAEEYAAWLEEEKEALRSILGERGWTPSTGWFTWDQKMVDETITAHEQTLQDIKDGLRVSKPMVDGDTIIQSGYDPDLQVTAADTNIALGSTGALESVSMEGTAVGEQQALTPELLSEYKAHGLTYDEQKKAFFWDGKLVRYFWDSYTLENGVAILYSYVNGDGVVDVCTIRKATQNSDGSTDPGGKLIRIEEVSQEEFDSRFVMTPQMAQETAVSGFVGIATGGYTVESGDTGSGFMADFERYAPFGVTFVKSGSFGNIYWNGELVHVLVDHAPDGKYQTIGSSDEGGINIRTVYDSNGKLVGIEPVKE